MEPRYRIINMANELTDPEAVLLDTILSMGNVDPAKAIRSILERGNWQGKQEIRGGCIIASAEQFRNDLATRCRKLLRERVRVIHEKFSQPAD